MLLLKYFVFIIKLNSTSVTSNSSETLRKKQAIKKIESQSATKVCGRSDEYLQKRAQWEPIMIIAKSTAPTPPPPPPTWGKKGVSHYPRLISIHHTSN